MLIWLNNYIKNSEKGLAMNSIHVLGAGTPTPTAERFGSSYVLNIDNESIMIDCGPATTYKLVKAGLWPTQIDYLFFTHHHFDHDVDYPCFLLCRWDQSIGKENILKVFGPTLTEKITEGIMGENGLFAHDWKSRINHPTGQRVYVNRGGTLPRKPPEINATDIYPHFKFQSDNWEILSDVAEHVQPWLDSLAYRINTKKGSYIFTGDTQPCQSIVNLAKDADIMFCMCWDDQDVMDLNGELVGCTGTKAAAEMAQEAGVKKLVLAHVGPNLAEVHKKEKAVNDIKSIYSGEIIFSNELMVLPI